MKLSFRCLLPLLFIFLFSLGRFRGQNFAPTKNSDKIHNINDLDAIGSKAEDFAVYLQTSISKNWKWAPANSLAVSGDGRS